MSISHHCIRNFSCLNFRKCICMLFNSLCINDTTISYRVYFGAYFVCIMKFRSVLLANLSYYACLSAWQRTIVFSVISLHNYFSHLISFNCSIVTYKRELKKHFNTSYNLPDVPNWNDGGIISLFFFHCFPCFLLFYFSIAPALFRTTLFIA